MGDLERRELVGRVVEAGWTNGGRNGYAVVEDAEGLLHEIWGVGTMSSALWTYTVSPFYPDCNAEVHLHPGGPPELGTAAGLLRLGLRVAGGKPPKVGDYCRKVAAICRSRKAGSDV